MSPDIDQQESCSSQGSCILSSVTLRICHVTPLNESCYLILTSKSLARVGGLVFRQRKPEQRLGNFLVLLRIHIYSCIYTYVFICIYIRVYLHICESRISRAKPITAPLPLSCTTISINVYLYVYTYVFVDLLVLYFKSETPKSALAISLYSNTYIHIFMDMYTYIHMYMRIYLEI